MRYCRSAKDSASFQTLRYRPEHSLPIGYLDLLDEVAPSVYLSSRKARYSDSHNADPVADAL